MVGLRQILLGCSVVLGASNAWSASLLNGDFQDFGGWQGLLLDAVTADEVIVDPTSDANFNLNGDGSATLTLSDTDVDNNGLTTIDKYFGIGLVQAFMVPLDATTLSFDSGWALSEGGTFGPDQVQASLVDLGNPASAPVDLIPLSIDTTVSKPALEPVTFDISQFAGSTLELQFFLFDGDLFSDTFTFGNIEIATADLAVVPIPPAFLLFMTGLGAFGIFRRKVLAT